MTRLRVIRHTKKMFSEDVFSDRLKCVQPLGSQSLTQAGTTGLQSIQTVLDIIKCLTWVTIAHPHSIILSNSVCDISTVHSNYQKYNGCILSKNLALYEYKATYFPVLFPCALNLLPTCRRQLAGYESGAAR